VFQRNKQQVFVGGYCGSGTRVIQWILKEAGYFTGDLVGVQEDYIPLAAVRANLILDKQINFHISHKEYLTKTFASWYGRHKKWSIKHGFLMLSVPVLKRVFPKCKIVIMVRHGVDNILNEHRMDEDICEYFAPEILEREDLLERRMLFWVKCHERLLEFKEKWPDDILIIKLENLADDRAGTTKKLFDFLGIKKDPDKCSKMVRKPSSIGRREKECLISTLNYPYFPDDKERLYKLGEKTLKKFNYKV